MKPTKKFDGKHFQARLYVDWPDFGEAFFSACGEINRRFTGSVKSARVWLAREIKRARREGMG